MSDSEEVDVTTSVLTGFLFGNIDQQGCLENDFLDRDICSRISTLASLGVGSYVDELKEDDMAAEVEATRDTLEKASDAVDYFNIETEADDYEVPSVSSNTNDGNNSNANISKSNNNVMATKPTESLIMETSESQCISQHTGGGASDDDYEANDDDDKEESNKNNKSNDTKELNDSKSKTVAFSTNLGETIKPMTSIATTNVVQLATTTPSTKTTTDLLPQTTDLLPQTTTTVHRRKGRRRHRRKAQLDTPLGCMLPKHLAHIDVTKYFPEFRRNKAVRFLKLFKPVHSCSMWKKKRPRSIINNKNINNKNNNINNKSDVNNKENTSKREGGRGDDWRNVAASNILKDRLPFKHELDVDDLDMLREQEQSMSRQASAQEVGSEMGRGEWMEWRHGAARLWYDRINLSSTQHCSAEYALKIKQGIKIDTEIDAESALKLQEAVASIEQPSSGLSIDISDLLEDTSILVSKCEATSRHEQKNSAMSSPRQPSALQPNILHNKSTQSNLTTSESPASSTSQPWSNSFRALEGVDMVVQQRWEEGIILNGEDVREKVIKELPSKLAKAGWLPHNNTRTFQASLQHHNQLRTLDMSKNIYPRESSLLASGDWLKQIIWDNKCMDHFLTPQSLTLDPFDDNVVLRLTDTDDDTTCNAAVTEEESKADVNKKDMKRSKSSVKNLFIKEGLPVKKEEEVETVGMMLADDDFYDPELSTESALGKNVCSTILQHSTPAVELRAVLFPCHLSITKLRNFHRPHLKKYSHGAMTSPGPHPVLSLLKQIRRKKKLREQERLASGGGEVFFMRSLEDLSSRDGDMLLFEYSEQHPPLLNQVGMATKIKNFYKRRPGQESSPPDLEYGDLAYTHTPPFLGTIKPGQCLRSLENNMFRAPIYQHTQPPSDFFIIRNRNHYYIRDANALFVVGQLCPLIEVPSPNSKKANNFVRESLQLSISRLFSMSKDEPKKIRMEDVRRQFPSHSESSIRKKLKLYADFKRTGMDSGWWVWKGNVRFPSEEEMRRLLVPEQCCAYYSMLSAQQRLKDAGYGEKVLFTIEDGDEEEVNNKLEDEVKAAPWNTTNAFISSMKGKCMLALGGFADPTSCGEGFAYVKVPNKPQQNKVDASGGQLGSRKMVTGTDADLRRLPLKEAKDLLRKLGLDEATVKKMGRWEVIDMVRKVSTEKAKHAEDGSWVNKFARGNKLTLLEHLERYKQECQRIFDLQNRVLGSEEVLSTDEEESSGDEEDMESMGRSIENMISSRKTSAQVQQEREERERQELSRMLKAGKRKSQESSTGSRKLQITRTFRGEDGRQYTRLEVVKKPALIDLYVKMRQHKDPSFIQQFTMVDNQMKEEMKKEKKRIQEKLRKLKRQEMDEDEGSHDNDHDTDSPLLKKKLKMDKLNKTQKLTCGACGKPGHMRTNKECPMFNKASEPETVVKPAKVLKVKKEEKDEDEEGEEEDDEGEEELVNVEGTKVTLSKHIVKQAEDLKRSMLVLKLPGRKEERRRKMSSQDDYLVKPRKVLKRCRADPVVSLMGALENILNEMREMPISTQFLQPVNSKKVPDYYDIIHKPMDLQTLRENLRDRKYTCRETFLKDVYLIVSNCKLYNGEAHPLSASAQKMFDHCLQRIAEKEERLMKLEKLIDPLLDDDDMVSLAFIITSIIEDRLKVVDGSVQFHSPVNRKQYKDYYDVIQTPIDLKTMNKKAQERKYRNRQEFFKDMELLVSNCSLYNGPHSSLTNTAHVLLDKCKQALKEHEEVLDMLEENIRQAQEEALYDDNDSVLTSLTGDAEGDVRGSNNHSFSIHAEAKKDREEAVVDVEEVFSNCHAFSADLDDNDDDDDDDNEDKIFVDDENTKLSADDVDDTDRVASRGDDDDGLDDDDDDDDDGDDGNNVGIDQGVVKEGEFDPQDFFNSLLHQGDNNNDDTNKKMILNDHLDGVYNTYANTSGDGKVGRDNEDEKKDVTYACFNSPIFAAANTSNDDGEIFNDCGINYENEEEEEEEELTRIEGAANLEDDLQLSDSEQSDKDDPEDADT